MSENILVVEYEPRYTERVRAALAGQPISAQFARDGEEAMKALEATEPHLIVLSSVVPKISAPELIRAIRGRGPTQQTPILLTVSGYSGTAPKQDAVRMGASDILPKPYSESEFLGKVQQLLGVGQLTSKDIFGDVLSENAAEGTAATPPPSPKPKTTPGLKTNDIDKMLDETLASVMPKKAKTSPGTTSLDKKLQDTLSGLEKSVRRTTSGGQVPTPAQPAAGVQAPTPVPAPTGGQTPSPVRTESAPATGGAPVVHAQPPVAHAEPPVLHDKVPVSQPVFPAAVPPLKEEEEPTDGVRFGQYVLQEKIATGGMAEVWKARMRGVEGFQKTVAIKKILPHLSDDKEFIEMFVDEAKLAAQLNHNNIVHIYDLGKIESSYYIAMEYVDGHDLKTILHRAADRGMPMTIVLALFIASKIASALDYAHRKRDFDEKEMGLVHRDVSPQNVLVSEDGDIKLCDFGIAKAASKASHTQAGALKGKLQYMSPEQAWARPIDRRSDIFALATVLYEMLTAKKLFTGDNEISILEQVREARVTPPSQVNDEVTPDIDRIVLKALAKDPSQRYQTAGEMARDIDALLYNFKPTPTSADLAIYMHHLWSAEPVVAPPRHEEPVAHVSPLEASRDLALTPPKAIPAAAPTLVDTPKPSTKPGTTAPGNVVMPAWDAPRAERKKSPIVPIAIAAVALIAIAGGAFFFMRGGSKAPVQQAATTTHAPVTTAASTHVPTATATGTAATQTTASAAVVQQPPALDPNAVNEEVQKRLAAERARLEAQQRAQAQQQQQQPAARQQPALGGGSIGATSPPRQPPVVQQQATQTVAPPPVQTNTQPAPTQSQPTASQPEPTATQAVATQAPAPPPVAKVREGDLVAAGTEGLVPATITRRGTVPYPPLARQEKIQGRVVLSVLVNENGQVLDVKVLRGRPGGLDEAAITIVRRSTFTPPTKDGVRVKSWTTVPVDFKL